jgi:serine/threonine protein kinase/Tol biopolymer transport system component
MVGQTVSHYRIIEKLGEGGMGVVYKAFDTELDRTVALKFLPHTIAPDESEQARFLQEAKAASALNHPNICTIHSLGEHEGQRFIDMEFVDGKTLRQILPVKKMQDAIAYAIQIAEALQEAHAHGIVHRDIKTENIMVNSKNQVKVMDFGLAKLKGSLKLTKTSSTIGTLAYMSPEQIRGEQVDARSDIFSFGIVLYEMLTGCLPFRGEHDAAIMYSLVNENPEPLQHHVPDAPSELLHILDRSLEKDREDRYQSANDMLIDLRRLKKDSSRVSRQPAAIPVTAVPAPPGEEKKIWRKRVWIGFAGMVVLCAIAVFVLVPGKHTVRLNPNRKSVTLRIPFKNIGVHSVSGDGNWISFTAKDENGKWDVYMMNLAGDRPNRITYENAFFMESAVLSPDASQIAYDCMDKPYTVCRVKIVSSQGGGSRTVADIGSGPRWRPDGQRIGYARFINAPSVSGKYEIWSTRPDGSDSRLEFIDTVDAGRPNTFCWSPDGRSIGWVRNYPEAYGEVMVRELATGRERQITFERKKIDEVTWATNDQILFASNKSGQSNLWMVAAGGGEATQVTEGGLTVTGARISSDNKSLVYMQGEDFEHLWISSIDGSNPRQISFDDVRIFDARISPDGKHVAAILADADYLNQESHLFVMDRDGKNQRQLTSGSERVVACAWSPDGKWLSYGSSPPGEPDDSIRVHLVQPFNPGPPRLLCKGYGVSWPDNGSLIIIDRMKSLMYSIRDGTATQIYLDSTVVLQFQDGKQVVFYDRRKGRGGWWVASIDVLRRQKGEPKRIPTGVDFAFPDNWSFLICIKGEGNKLCRVSTSTWKEEIIGEALPGQAGLRHVSMDGKEILWGKADSRWKLVLVKNLFE